MENPTPRFESTLYPPLVPVPPPAPVEERKNTITIVLRYPPAGDVFVEALAKVKQDYQNGVDPTSIADEFVSTLSHFGPYTHGNVSEILFPEIAGLNGKIVQFISSEGYLRIWGEVKKGGREELFGIEFATAWRDENGQLPE